MHYYYRVLIVCTTISTLTIKYSVAAEHQDEIPHNEVKNWALKFGVDLWEFGKQFTKMHQIQSKYHEYGAEVARRDGLLLLRELATEVRNFMDFKINAVMRIMDSAEQAGAGADTSTDISSLSYYDARWLNVHSDDGKLAERARKLALTPSRHFDHLAINTSYSAILSPSHVSLEELALLKEIKWSEHLDPIFINNYESDHTLSWQYYASSSGFMRRFPAMSWPPEDGLSHHARDFYDFRSSPWFVEAASSPKDLIILLEEGSGTLGIQSAAAILETLGPNDFVNIFKYGDKPKEIHNCYENMLAQATTESVRELRAALWRDATVTSGSPNLTAAIEMGFQLLHHYNRTGKGCQCNQALVVIGPGSGVGGSRRVFLKMNWPHKQVRVFTMALKTDSSTAHALKEAACSNKGYYSYISSSKDIKPAVFDMIKVMARPMVLYQSDHPPRFSPIYVGGRGSSFADDGLGQLMMSVSMPVFDRRNHTHREANLLGVVGTEVSINEIKKLVPPYRLGVNGYSFILDNNGQVVYHPDLRPVHTNEEYTETLRPTYCTVDFMDVELLIDNDTDGRGNTTALLLDLRRQMIERNEGETELLQIVDTDHMYRVTTRRQRYFYTPIHGTPYTLALVLPEPYGSYDLIAQQEIKWSAVEVTEYFKGSNWKIHPDWVYCEYESVDAVKFSSAEERVVHFMSRAARPGWKWMSVRPRATHHSAHVKHDKDAYFCDKTLMQSLVRDAMVLKEIDSHASLHNHHNQQGYEKFGVVLSFIATRSGLLKWNDNNSTKHSDKAVPHFSEKYIRAIESEWYTRAVEHHTIEPDSFVFTVEDETGVISATHALFIENRGHKAPAAVVGLHFQLNTLAKHFINVTSTCTSGSSCRKTCAGDELDCYILDDNGFIIFSEETKHIGQFFGRIDGTIMDSLVQDKIYKRVAVYDYQGKCPDGQNPYSADANQIRPFSILWLANWIRHVLISWISLFELLPVTALEEDDLENYGDGEDYEVEPGHTDYEIVVAVGSQSASPTLNPIPTIVPATTTTNVPPAGVRSCRTRTDLYQLQSARLNVTQPLKGKLTNCHNSGCERPFSVQKIPHSNLILLVVDTLCPCGTKKFSITAMELPPLCKSTQHRRRPSSCINYHPEESEIKPCGKGNTLLSSYCATLSVFIIWFMPLL